MFKDNWFAPSHLFKVVKTMEIISTNNIQISFPLTRFSDALGNPTFISIITQIYI